MVTEESVKKLKTKNLLKLFFEKAQRSSIKPPKENKEYGSEAIKSISLSDEEEAEMYIVYEELQLRAGEYDRMKKE